MKKKPIVVEGYTIIKQEQVGEVMVALGHNPNASITPFVTWKSYEHSGFKSFDHGNYFATRQQAMIDFHARLAEAWEYYTPAKNPEKPKPKKPSRSDPPAR